MPFFSIGGIGLSSFCYIDDCMEMGAKLIEGELHSVQPIVLEKKPVYRLNRRYYHLLQTANFGPVVQIEVGAVLVGDVYQEKDRGGITRRGEEAGHFELCGSTILLLFTSEIANKFSLLEEVEVLSEMLGEYPVNMGQVIGFLDTNKICGLYEKECL